MGSDVKASKGLFSAHCFISGLRTMFNGKQILVESVNCLKRIGTLLTLVQQTFIPENYFMNPWVRSHFCASVTYNSAPPFRSRHSPSLPLPIWEASSVEEISEEKKKNINKRLPLYSSVKHTKVTFTVYPIQCHLLTLYSGTCQRTLEALGLNWVIDKLFLHPGGTIEWKSMHGIV